VDTTWRDHREWVELSDRHRLRNAQECKEPFYGCRSVSLSGFNIFCVIRRQWTFLKYLTLFEMGTESYCQYWQLWYLVVAGYSLRWPEDKTGVFACLTPSHRAGGVAELAVSWKEAKCFCLPQSFLFHAANRAWDSCVRWLHLHLTY